MVLAVPTPITYTAGQILTAGQLNTNLRDAINFAINPPLFQGVVVAAQSLTTGTPTDILWDTNNVDTYGGHSITVNTARYVAQIAGYYRVSIKLAYSPGATGVREAAVAKNGTQIAASLAIVQAVSLALTSTTITTDYVVQLNVNDYITAQGYQSNGGALPMTPTLCKIDVVWVHV